MARQSSLSGKSASPAERSEELAAHQRQLKQEAAERRLQAAGRPNPKARSAASGSRRPG
jgi:hypothetical protein